MTDTQIIATAVASVAGPQGAMLLVGYLADRPDEVRRWWAGRAAGARTARDVVRRYVTAAARGAGRAALAGVLAVLCAVLRAHGRHRLGVRT